MESVRTTSMARTVQLRWLRAVQQQSEDKHEDRHFPYLASPLLVRYWLFCHGVLFFVGMFEGDFVLRPRLFLAFSHS